MSDRVKQSPPTPPLARLAGGLALFLVPGALGAVYVWHVLNDLLTGHNPGVSLWIGLAVLLALAGWLRLLRGWLRRMDGQEGAA